MPKDQPRLIWLGVVSEFNNRSNFASVGNMLFGYQGLRVALFNSTRSGETTTEKYKHIADHMNSLHIATVAIVLRARVPRAGLMKHLPASPYTLGADIAQQAHDYALREQLGYYPPLEFLKSQNAVDDYLLVAVDHVATLSSVYVRQQIMEKLTTLFSSVHLQSIQVSAFSLPPIRPHQLQALEHLARHYTPDVVKCDLLISVIQKQKVEQGLDRFVSTTVKRWLVDEFEEFEITSARFV